jgi:F-type H+-transporting ATPase subunit delta
VKAEQLTQSYAEAIYQAAFETWLTALAATRDGLQANPEIARTLTDAGRSPDEKRAAVRELLLPGVTEKMENAVLLMASNGDLRLLGETTAEFERMFSARAFRVIAHVTTAIVLTESEQAAMRQKLTSEMGGELDFDFKVDPTILGGVIVRVGGRVVDDSVISKLTALRETLGVSESH